VATAEPEAPTLNGAQNSSATCGALLPPSHADPATWALADTRKPFERPTTTGRSYPSPSFCRRTAFTSFATLCRSAALPCLRSATPEASLSETCWRLGRSSWQLSRLTVELPIRVERPRSQAPRLLRSPNHVWRLIATPMPEGIDTAIRAVISLEIGTTRVLSKVLGANVEPCEPSPDSSPRLAAHAYEREATAWQRTYRHI
jgi:hypothetical protein